MPSFLPTGIPHGIPHPSAWPGLSGTPPQANISASVPWETTQLNVTSSGVLDYTHIHTQNPPTFAPFPFEVFPWKEWTTFAFVHWHLPFLVGAAYLALIFALRSFMAPRQPLRLKWPLFFWNATLGLFSVAGLLRTAPEFFSILLGDGGLYQAVCFRNGGNFPTGFWSLLFVLSKYVELGDTVFIILRKRPLVFIQWYHHLVTLIMSWLTAPYVEPIARWYVLMNYGVHSMMYPYFALKALNIHIPRRIATFITTCQLGQMLIGLGVNLLTAALISLGVPCYRHPFSLRLSGLVYGSFTLLFGKLLYDILHTNRTKPKAA